MKKIALIFLLFLFGCRAPQMSTKTEFIHDTLTEYVTKVETAYDSVYIDRWLTPDKDSIMVYRYKYLTKTDTAIKIQYVDRMITDTICIKDEQAVREARQQGRKTGALITGILSLVCLIVCLTVKLNVSK